MPFVSLSSHHSDVPMGSMGSQITSLTIVYLLSRLFGRSSKKTSKLRVTGLCAGNSPGTGEFPAQKASNAENVSIWWRNHGSERRLIIWSNYQSSVVPVDWIIIDWGKDLSPVLHKPLHEPMLTCCILNSYELYWITNKIVTIQYFYLKKCILK